MDWLVSWLRSLPLTSCTHQHPWCGWCRPGWGAMGRAGPDPSPGGDWGHPAMSCQCPGPGGTHQPFRSAGQNSSAGDCWSSPPVHLGKKKDCPTGLLHPDPCPNPPLCMGSHQRAVGLMDCPRAVSSSSLCTQGQGSPGWVSYPEPKGGTGGVYWGVYTAVLAPEFAGNLGPPNAH